MAAVNGLSNSPPQDPGLEHGPIARTFYDAQLTRWKRVNLRGNPGLDMPLSHDAYQERLR
jgi:hypothetical protein